VLEINSENEEQIRSKPITEIHGFNVENPPMRRENITSTSQPQLSLFSWSVYKNIVMITSGLQEDYIANPNPYRRESAPTSMGVPRVGQRTVGLASLWSKPLGDRPLLHTPTWPPSRILDHNSIIRIDGGGTAEVQRLQTKVVVLTCYNGPLAIFVRAADVAYEQHR
jgi:hypothetical protein